MSFIKELQDRFGACLKEAEEIRLKYQGSPTTMTGEEEARWTQLMDDADRTKAQIETAEREDKLKAWSSQSAGMLPLASGLPQETETSSTKSAEDGDATKGWDAFLRGGLKAVDTAGLKALQADSGSAGGFLIAPEVFVARLIQQMRDLVFMRALAGQVLTVTKSESVGVPTLEAHPADADWTIELGTGSEDSTMAFGKRELTPHPFAKRLKVSNKLLRQSAIDVDSLIRDLLAYKFGITEEKAFLTGTGNLQPLGVFTADANGVTTARDVTTTVSADIAADDLISLKYSLKMQYHKNAQWIFHRDTLKKVRKLKSGDGNYLWTSGMGPSGPGGGLQGTSPTLLDLPYNVSEYAPSTYTTALYVAVLGDFNFYWIVDALDMQLQVLDQLYAETNQTGYIARRESDGMPTLSEAFARLKLL